jgi:TM2 domain-containing membrane protein YozV
MYRFLLLFLIFISCALVPLFGQFDETTTQQDTSNQADFGLFTDSNKNTFRVLFSGNPGRAALYSLIIPGAGQFYNKRYWKIPLVYAGLGAVSYLLYNNNYYYQKKKRDYIASIGTAEVSLNYNYYIQAKKNRELAIFAVIGVHLFNVFDAYIDRHLIDFDMDENLSIKLTPYPDGQSTWGLSFTYALGN